MSRFRRFSVKNSKLEAILLFLIIVYMTQDSISSADGMKGSFIDSVNAVIISEITSSKPATELGIVFTVTDPKIIIYYNEVQVHVFSKTGDEIPITPVKGLDLYVRSGRDGVCSQGYYVLSSDLASKVARVSVRYKGVPCDNVKLFYRTFSGKQTK